MISSRSELHLSFMLHVELNCNLSGNASLCQLSTRTITCTIYVFYRNVTISFIKTKITFFMPDCHLRGIVMAIHIQTSSMLSLSQSSSVLGILQTYVCLNRRYWGKVVLGLTALGLNLFKLNFVQLLVADIDITYFVSRKSNNN